METVTNVARSQREFLTVWACCAIGVAIAFVGMWIWLGLPLQEYASYLERTKAGMCLVVAGVAGFGPVLYLSLRFVRVARAR